MTAQVDGAFVVFLVGMRINRPFRVQEWLPMVKAFGDLKKELYESNTDSGFMGCTNLGFLTQVQYWQSLEHLEAYIQGDGHRVWPAWDDFTRKSQTNERRAFGVWYEAFLVEDGAYSSLYTGMPAHGLGKCGALNPLRGAA